MAEFLAKGQREWTIKFKNPPGNTKKWDSIIVRRSAWAKTICWNMNVLCRQKSEDIVEELHRNIRDYTGFRDPEQGMSKAFFCLTTAQDRNIAWLLNQQHTTTKIEENAGRTGLDKPECKSEEYGGEYNPAPWKKRRHQSEAKASTDEVEHPWRKDLKKEKAREI